MNCTASPDACTMRHSQSLPFALALFGLPEFTHCGQPVEIARRQTRALLYRLGATLKPIPRETLCAMFWPDTDDGTAHRNLARLLNLLRSELPQAGILDASSTAVALNPDLVWSDANTMANLHRRNQPGADAEAAALYRGPFLSGFTLRNNVEFDSWQSATNEQLQRLYLTTLARLIVHNTEIGDLRSAIGFARRYLEIDCLAEAVHRQLITLYSLAGERFLAVRQFEECRSVLARELGVEPLPETQAACQAAVNGAGAVALAASAPPVAWHTLPSLNLPLIGREPVLQQLSNSYTRLSRGGFIFIYGEPGTGLSRLLQAFATQQDAFVLAGHSHIGAQTLPYYPLLEMLRQGLASPFFGQGVQPFWLAEAACQLPDVRIRYPNLPPIDGKPRQGQVRFFEAMVQILLGFAERRQVLLCFDDLHWADDATLEWLLYAADRLRLRRVCVVATCRAQEGMALASLQRTLRRDGRMATVPLEPLSVDSVAAVLREVKRPDPQDPITASRIHRATGGNTFFVLEVVRELAELGLLENPPDPLPLPSSVQETLHRRFGRLSTVAKQVLEAAAVLGADLDFRLVQLTTGREELEVADGVDELLRHQMLASTEQGIALQHDLVRQFVYGELSEWRRRLLHGRAADALVQMHQQDASRRHASAARHYAAAGYAEPALHHYLLAADATRRLLAYGAAADYAAQRSALIGPRTPPAKASALLELLGGNPTFSPQGMARLP
jgi:DNA-binding SARP family transcriptional activator